MTVPAIPSDDRRLDLLCFGEPLVEFTQVPDPPTPAHFVQGFGGDTSNTAIAAARQGAVVGFLGAVGRDRFGDAVLALWRSEQIDTSAVIRHPTAPTGLYFVTPHARERHFTYRRAGSAASLMTARDVSGSAIRSTKLLHTSAISQAISDGACNAVHHAIRLARAAGTLVSYDSNLRLDLWPLARARQVTNETMATCDIVLPSIDDSRQLTKLSDDDAILDFYLAQGPRVVALKMGSDGAYIATTTERHRLPAVQVAAVDATGAGDTFNGAFLAVYAKAGCPFTAGRYAVAAAALTTTGYGAVAPIPSRPLVEAVRAEEAPH